MKEFNYKRAWREYYTPEFDALPSWARVSLGDMRSIAGLIRQSKNLTEIELIHNPGEDALQKWAQMWDRMDEVSSDDLARVSQIVYFYGHLSPIGSLQPEGLYWKFQKLCDMKVQARNESEFIAEFLEFPVESFWLE